MLNSVFRIGSSSRQQPQQQAARPVAKQHASVMEADANTPTRRALAPVSGNQVNAMQRIRNFVAGPSAGGFAVMSDASHIQQTASAKKVRLRVPPALCAVCPEPRPSGARARALPCAISCAQPGHGLTPAAP